MARVHHHYARLNGVRYHFTAVGDGPAVVLLHGFPETHRSWDATWPALVESGFRCVSPDLRGYGETARPAGGYDLPTLADDVAALVRHLGDEKVSLVGHDWGGAIAWQVASRHPGLLERLIVIDCPHPLLMARALRTNPRQLRRSWYMFFFQLPLLPRLWLLSGRGRPLGTMWRDASCSDQAPRSIVDAEREALRGFGRLRAPIEYYRAAFRANVPALLSGRPLAGYAPIDLPVTLIWGEEDSCLGAELVAGHSKLAHQLRVHVIARGGHFVHQELPTEVNRVLLDALRAT